MYDLPYLRLIAEVLEANKLPGGLSGLVTGGADVGLVSVHLIVIMSTVVNSDFILLIVLTILLLEGSDKGFKPYME